MTSQTSSELGNQNSTPLSSFRRGILSRISSRTKSKPKAGFDRENSIGKNDPQTDLQVFQLHWQKVRAIIAGSTNATLQRTSSKTPSTSDDCESVINLTSDMVKILTKKEDSNIPGSPTTDCDSRILDYFYSEEVLDRLLNWMITQPEIEERMTAQLLSMLGSILSQRSCQFFLDRQILRPLFRLISSCAQTDNRKLYEEKLAEVFNHLCYGISQYIEVFEILFSENYVESDSGGHSLMYTLLSFVHWDGVIGQQARDMLQVIICLASSHEDIATYIVSKSNFCPVLAAGLTGLYSSLPRALTYTSDDWSGISEDDIIACPDLQRFMTSLKFCDDIIKVLLPSARQQLLEFIYNGFLVPVIAPGLHQGASGVEEVIATTAYLNLFINKITDPHLLRIFLQFILQVKVDEFSILDILIQRVGSQQTKLCVITLVLFRTLVHLNCEDVMYHLIFKYLLPCSHVMTSQQRAIDRLDLYSVNAEKILALIPTCCNINTTENDNHISSVNALCDNISTPRDDSLSPLERSKWWQSIRRKKTPSIATRHSITDIRASIEPAEDSYESSYYEYLQSARNSLDSCRKACEHWSGSYTVQNSEKFALPEPLKINSTMSHIITTDTDLRGFKLRHPHGGDVRSLDSTFDKVAEADLSKGNVLVDVVQNGDSKDSLDIPDLPQYRVQSNTSSSSSSSAVLNASLSDDLSSFLSSLDRVTLVESSTGQPDEVFKEIESFKVNLKPVVDLNRNIDVQNASFDSQMRRTANAIPEVSLANVVTSEPAQRSKEFDKSGVADMSNNEGLPRPVTLNLNDFTTKSQLRSSPSPSVSFRNFSTTPTIGPFLKSLLQRLESMKQNTFYVNLHLTGLISRLACYPQPILASTLLSQTIVFQPSVKSLAQVLNSVKCRLEEYFIQVTDKDLMMVQALHYLKYRVGQIHTEPRLSVGDNRSFLASRRSSLSSKPLALLGARQGARYAVPNSSSAQSLITNDSPEFLEKKNAIYCALVLKEFLKELAAISQAHTTFQLQSS